MSDFHSNYNDIQGFAESDEYYYPLSFKDVKDPMFFLGAPGRIQPTHIEQTLVPHFTDDTVLVTDSHKAYKTVANKYKIPLNQIPSGKHTSGGFHLEHVNGYHHNISDLAEQTKEIFDKIAE